MPILHRLHAPILPFLGSFMPLGAQYWGTRVYYDESLKYFSLRFKSQTLKPQRHANHAIVTVGGKSLLCHNTQKSIYMICFCSVLSMARMVNLILSCML
jgi:hypothetical protein